MDYLWYVKPKVVEQHHAKVYGKAKVGAPPMSVPHLDTRYIDNKKLYCSDHSQGSLLSS